MARSRLLVSPRVRLVEQDREQQREGELRKEGRELRSRVRSRVGPISVRMTLGQPTMIARQQHMTSTAWRYLHTAKWGSSNGTNRGGSTSMQEAEQVRWFCVMDRTVLEQGEGN